MKWEPIETAPKDGTIVDLWNGVSCQRLVNVAWLKGRDRDHRCAPGGVWHHHEEEGWDYVGSTEGCGCLVESQFSHWMPLPDAPKATP